MAHNTYGYGVPLYPYAAMPTPTPIPTPMMTSPISPMYPIAAKQNIQGIIWVNGKDEATIFQLPVGWPANTPVALWDKNAPLIYLKSVNAVGVPNPLQTLPYDPNWREEENTPPAAAGGAAGGTAGTVSAAAAVAPIAPAVPQSTAPVSPIPMQVASAFDPAAVSTAPVPTPVPASASAPAPATATAPAPDSMFVTKQDFESMKELLIADFRRELEAIKNAARKAQDETSNVAPAMPIQVGTAKTVQPVPNTPNKTVPSGIVKPAKTFKPAKPNGTQNGAQNGAKGV